MSKLVRVSPSQIKEAMDPDTGCWRRWGHNHVDHFQKGPPDANQKFGLDGHDQLEHYFKSHGRIPLNLNSKPGQAAYPAIASGLLPLPSPYVVAEGAMEFEFDGILYNGKIDLLWAEASNHLIINDHKFTKDFKWALTPEKLVHDPQRIIYATWGIFKYAPDWVTCRWTYNKSKPKYQAMQRTLTQHRSQIINEHFPIVHEQALRIKAARRLKSEDLPQNTSACRAFNRDCDFSDDASRRSTAWSFRP
jgi:hypothetical protein